MTRTDTLLTYYRNALHRCLDVYGRLTGEDWTSRARGSRWSARDYLGHLATSQENEGNVTTRLNLEGKPVALPGLTSRDQINEFNQRNLDKVRDLSPKELLERFRAAFEAHIAMLEPLSDDDLARPARLPPGDREVDASLEQVFSTFYLHLPIHYQDIRRQVRARRALPHWMELAPADEVHDMYNRQFGIMPLFYVAERGGNLRASIVFTLKGDGGGQWTLEIEGGRCQYNEGAPERATLEFRTTPARWLDFVTRELKPLPAILTGRIRLRGSLGLAMRMDRLFEID